MGLNWNKKDLPTLAEKQAKMASDTCQSLIYAGIDVDLSNGIEHFSLSTHDQTNIDSMLTAVTLGATEYPYHSDGNRCVVYPKADIVKLYIEYKSYVTYQTTYCNFLKAWIAREEDREVLGGITYGSELPEDLAEEMNAILAEAKKQIDNIVAALS